MQLAPYLLIAAGLLSTLALFISLKYEIWRQAQRQMIRIEEVAEHALQPAAEELFVPAPLRAGLNLSKRVHALRMLRRGEDISYIAAALGVPRKEVELMIRVQAIGRARAASAD